MLFNYFILPYGFDRTNATIIFKNTTTLLMFETSKHVPKTEKR